MLTRSRFIALQSPVQDGVNLEFLTDRPDVRAALSIFDDGTRWPNGELSQFAELAGEDVRKTDAQIAVRLVGAEIFKRQDRESFDLIQTVWPKGGRE